MSRLDAIKARLEAATPGPWNKFGQTRHVYSELPEGTLGGFLAEAINANDANLIAHAPADLAALLRVAEAARLALNWTRHGATCTVYDANGNYDPDGQPCNCGINAIAHALAALDEPEG